MYRRVVVTLYGGCRGRTAGALTVTRYTDHTLKCFSLGNVHCSENKPPEDQVTSKPPTEGKKSPEDQVNAKPAEEKVEVLHKKDSSQPPQMKTLQNIISGIKVEVSSPKRLLAVKRGRMEGQKWANIRDGVESVSKMFQMASKTKQPEEKEVGPEMAAAVSAVASTFPDKKNEVKSELLRHLLLHKQMGKKQGEGDLDIRKVISGMQVEGKSKSSILKETIQEDNLRQMLTKQIRKGEKEVGPEMTAAVSAVASTFPDKKNEVKSELLRHLLLHKQMGKKQGEGDLNIRKVISGMQVEGKSKSSILKETIQEDNLRQMLTKQIRKGSQKLTGKKLQIFPVPPRSQETTITVLESESSPTLWDIEFAKEIATACEQRAINGFEEMIQWTNEGKLWMFPINNEAGLDEEQNVEFHEHIFLDRYLEDFPKQGPIRHFMELVVCGLSKNPFLTVQQKKEHIDWFQDYFKQKEEILKESNVYLN